MSTSPDEFVSVSTTDTERRELYRILDIRAKLASGQAYLVVGRVMSRPPKGDFPTGSRSRMVEIRLSVNDWFLCYAHQYVGPFGEELTEPDPKAIRIDDVIFKQGG